LFRKCLGQPRAGNVLHRVKALSRKEAEMDLAFWISFWLVFFMIIAVLVAVGVLVFPLPF
jgi:hypothetical protein